MVGVTNQSLWSRLCTALDCGDLINDPQFATNGDRVVHRHELVDRLSEAISARSASDVVEQLRAVGIPSSLIRDIGQLPGDPQVSALELIGRTSEGVLLPVVPVSVDGGLADLADVSIPKLGCSTTDVLCAAGFSSTDLEILRREDVIQ
jgi:formyl-CoA transferase/CoA:oxalate CoA-transferase